MRIFCAVRHAIDPSQFYGSLWSSNFYPALRQLGHEVVESETDLAPGSAFMGVSKNFSAEQLAVRGRTTTAIIDELKRAHAEKPIDLFLSYFYNSHFDSSAFEEIHRLGIPTINFYCNSIYQFDLVDQIAPKARYAWYAEKPAKPFYDAIGANGVWVQMAADPNVYKPIQGALREKKAVFVGQRYADRADWAAALVQAKVPLDLYGPNWGEPMSKAAQAAENAASARAAIRRNYLREIQRNLVRSGPIGGSVRTIRQWKFRRHVHQLLPLFKPIAKGAIPFTKICDVFSSYEVVLNFSNVWADGRPGSELIPHVRLRDFEAPMCRTCFLTGHTEEISEFYDIGREIDTYRSPQELVDKTRFYLSNPQSAEKLRQAGYERAVRDHTWVRRFQQLFREIGMQTT
jgi:spore maturation protein CgeB